MEEYFGFLEKTLSDEEINALYQPESGNSFGCIQNQYLHALDAAGNSLGIFRWNGEKMIRVPFKAIKGRFINTIKPRNIQQQMAIDLLYNTDTTVKILTGKFGTGEIFAP